MDRAKKPFGRNLLTYDLAQGFPVWLSFRIAWRRFQNADSQAPFSLPEDSGSEGLGNLFFTEALLVMSTYSGMELLILISPSLLILFIFCLYH